MLAKTIESEQVWQAPDKAKTIWNVTLESGGKQYPLKTYSEKIAQVGFEGDVESYVNQRGDRFVKQIAKQQGGFKGQPRDDAAIKAQWAIGQAIALASATMDKSTITMKVIENYAKQLYATVSRVKGESYTPDMERQANEYIDRMTSGN
jgi:hypothetical protein